MKTPLRVLSISDIHLGATNTRAQHIVDNMNRILPEAIASGSIDLLVIVGDLWDRSLSLHADAVHVAQIWMYHLLSLCKRHNVVLRILEGTPSHDREQSRMFETANSSGGFGVDFRYVNRLEIEHIDALGIDVLYIPDEWRPDPTETWKEVEALLQQKQLTQVDLTLLHGTADFQLPNIVTHNKHEMVKYETISRLGVFMGHVHEPSHRGRIWVNGSFDRLGHGEEHQKGCWRVTFQPDGNYQATFLVNRGAKVYRSFDCTGCTVEEGMDILSECLQYPADSHFRIIAERGNPLLRSLDIIRKTYPTMRWTSKAIDDVCDTPVQMLVDHRHRFQSVQLTPENVLDQILGRLTQSDPQVQSLCRQLLEEVYRDP